MRFAVRRPRRLAVWLVGVLLFAQLAAAAHACPAWLEPARDAIAMAAMPGCELAAADAPASDFSPLCRSHCSPDAQSSSPAPSADLSAHPVLLAVLDWTPTAQRTAQPAGRISVVRSGAPPPGSPPLYLSLLVLRN